MSLRLITGLLGVILSASDAFIIPDGTPNGVYSVKTYPNGTEVHTRIGDPVLSLLRPRHVQRRQSYWDTPMCYPDEGTEDLDHSTTDAANAALQAQCGGGATIFYGDDFYSLAECVVAYACNFASDSYYTGDTTCYASESVTANQLITNTCGAYKPGSVMNHNSVSYGYESYCTSRGHNFCGRGA